MKRSDLILYAVTAGSGPGLYKAAEEALKGGVTMLQLREKELKGDAYLEEVLTLKELCRKYRVPFIVNDNVGMALGADADGVHLGQDDLDAKTAREILGPDKIIGVSAHNKEEAVAAEKAGADYLGAGAVFVTGSKSDAKPLKKETLQEIVNAVSIPVVAIGGITLKNMGELKDTGIAGIAVIGAIFGAEDKKGAAEKLRRAAAEITG